jgi:hypothetical protein
MSARRLIVGMDRILRVNAFTTFDLIDAEAQGHDFTESGPAVVNVTADRKDPDEVRLEVELDNTALETLPAHADRVHLSAEQARTLASELVSYAERVEAATGDDSDSGADADTDVDD